MTTILLNSWFHLALLVIAFYAVSRWVIASSKAYLGYLLGILIAMFIAVVYSVLVPFETLNMASIEYRLSLFQVVIPLALGVMIASTILVAAWLFKNNTIERELRATILILLVLLSMFTIVISTPVLSVMVTLFFLTISNMLLFAHVAMRSVQSQTAVASEASQMPVQDSSATFRAQLADIRSQIATNRTQPAYKADYRA